MKDRLITLLCIVGYMAILILFTLLYPLWAVAVKAKATIIQNSKSKINTL